MKYESIIPIKETLTITLSSDLKLALEDLTQAEGLSTDSLISKAVEDFLFIHRFRNLRDHLMQKAEASYTDKDIFEMVS
jgi:predicted transcriptional regulator